jgi:hypothetical protein
MSKTVKPRAHRPAPAAPSPIDPGTKKEVPNPRPPIPAGKTVHVPKALLDRHSDIYAMVLYGDCLQPKLREGDTAISSPTAPLVPGQYVILWPIEGEPLMKLLRSVPPWRPRPLMPEENVIGICECEMTNPPRFFQIPFDRLKAIDAVIGVLRGGKLVHVAPVTPEPKPMPRRQSRRSIAAD